MTTAPIPLQGQLSPWKYELLMAEFYAPYSSSLFETDGQEESYNMFFEEVLDKEKLDKYTTKEDVLDGVVFDSIHPETINSAIYQLLLSNSVEDAKTLNDTLDIIWWQTAREDSLKSFFDGSCNEMMGWDHRKDDDDYNDFDTDCYRFYGAGSQFRRGV